MVREALSGRVTDVAITVANTLEELEALVERGPDVVWNGFTGNPVVRHVTGFLAERGLEFVGSTEAAMAGGRLPFIAWFVPISFKQRAWPST